MKFPNAAKGVKKIFTAEILTLISALAMIVAVVMMIVTLGAAAAESAGGAVAAGIGTLALMAGAAILALIGGIMSLVGIINASKDESAFKTALYAIILSLVAAVVMGIFSSNDTVQSICQSVQNVMSIIVTIYVIQGVTNLAEKLNNAEVAQKGKKLLYIIVAVYVLALIANIIVLISGGMFASVTAGIIGLAALVLDVIGYIVYLSLLSKGKKMLEA